MKKIKLGYIVAIVICLALAIGGIAVRQQRLANLQGAPQKLQDAEQRALDAHMKANVLGAAILLEDWSGTHDSYDGFVDQPKNKADFENTLKGPADNPILYLSYRVFTTKTSYVIKTNLPASSQMYCIDSVNGSAVEKLTFDQQFFEAKKNCAGKPLQ